MYHSHDRPLNAATDARDYATGMATGLGTDPAAAVTAGIATLGRIADPLVPIDPSATRAAGQFGAQQRQAESAQTSSAA